MRRIFYLLFALILVVSVCIPACALGTGTSSVYAPLQFDTLYNGTNYSVSSAWNGNQFGASSGGTVNGFNYFIESDIATSGAAKNILLDVAAGPYFRLYSVDQIVDSAYLFSYKVGFGVDLEYSGTIDYSFSVVTMEKVTNVWKEGFTSISGSWDVEAGSYFNLGSKIAQEIARVTSDRLVRLRDFTLTFNISTDGGSLDSPIVDFRFSGIYDANMYSAAWLNQFGMEYKTVFQFVDPTDDVDVTGWLGATLQGIWSAEIIPGFSFGGLASLLFGFGILFLLLKIFSGG